MKEILLKGNQFQWSPVQMRGLLRWSSASIEICFHGGFLQGNPVTMEVCLGEFCLEGRVLQRTVSKDLCFEEVFMEGCSSPASSTSMGVVLKGRPSRWKAASTGALPRWRSASMEVCLDGGLPRWRSVSMEIVLEGTRAERSSLEGSRPSPC